MKRKALSTVVFEGLTDLISSRHFGPGDQLPTEAELCAKFEVSRTVVREAVARLRSHGVVIPRQGKGVFVSEAPATSGFSVSAESLKTLKETISLLELRLALETESAGLCAERCSTKDAQTIREVMERVDNEHPNPDDIQIHYDYDFHLAIARASTNEHIFGFLDYLRPILVPRFQLGYLVATDLKDRYFDRIHVEHEEIVSTIERKDAEGARTAMRHHLMNSLERLRALARASGSDTSR